MFNNLLGRFGAPDPYRQMHNAYQGMGNNPANFVNPSGGLFSGWGAWMNAQNARQEAWNRAMVWGFIHDRELTKSGGAFGGGPVTVDGLQTSNSAGMLYYKNMSSQGLATMSSNAYDITLSDQWGNNFRGTSMEAATAKFANATPGYKVNHNPDGPTNAKPWKGMAEGHGLPIMNITADGPDNMNQIRAAVQAVLSGTNNRVSVRSNGSTLASAVTFALITSAADGPLPFGEAVGAVVLTGALVYTIIYENKELLAKKAREIERIMTKKSGSPGFQYSLRATVPGFYPIATGGAIWLNAGDVWKYGETTQGENRYSNSYLNSIGPGVMMVPEFFGSQVEIKVAEKGKIYGYFFSNGTLPPGNKIFR